MSGICGGVMKKSKFLEDPMAYMMAFVMEDDDFERYEAALKAGDTKTADKIFRDKAWSAV